MSGEHPTESTPSGRSLPSATLPGGVPSAYVDAYERAYRESLAQHATELISPARPGKRAAQPSHALVAAVAELLADQRRLRVAVAVGLVVLLALAYGAGRLVAAG